MASTRPSHSHNSCCNIPQVSILLNNKNTETIYVENPIKTADLINKLAKTKQEFMLSSVVKAEPFAIKFYNQIKPMVLQVSIQTNAKLTFQLFLAFLKLVYKTYDPKKLSVLE